MDFSSSLSQRSYCLTDKLASKTGFDNGKISAMEPAGLNLLHINRINAGVVAPRLR
jgi:hypothetical protein